MSFGGGLAVKKMDGGNIVTNYDGNGVALAKIQKHILANYTAGFYGVITVKNLSQEHATNWKIQQFTKKYDESSKICVLKFKINRLPTIVDFFKDMPNRLNLQVIKTEL